jgi:hypothetical protein
VIDPEHIPDTSTLRIPFRVNFVMQSLAGWEDVAQTADCPDADAMPQRIRPVDAIWIAQGYMRMKRRGHDVRLTDRFVPGEVCVALGAMRISRKPYKSFTIAAQTHLLKARICDCNIVQNRELLERPNEFFMIHWPQPGLAKRDPDRGTRIERIGYFGDESLSGQLTSPAFLRQLDHLGMTLITPEQWHDYHDTDLVLAVRNVPPAYTRFKPPSKLINAWAVGCPALLGPEQAFASLRRSPLDYFEVKNPHDVLAALRRLKAEPELYQAMVANGALRFKDFSVDAVARRWEEFFAGPVAERYQKWLAGPKAWRAARNLARFAGRIVEHKLAIRAVDRFNNDLKTTGFNWGKTGGASMPPEAVVATA